jgi:hypothetical protein
MNIQKTLRQGRSLIVLFVLASVALVGLAVWRAAAAPQDKSHSLSQSQIKTILHAGIQEGVGREVRFTKSNDSAEAVQGSIESLANFIQARSGVELGTRTKETLAQLEQQTLAGNRNRITVEALVNSLTETGLERLSTLSDEEIEYAANTLHEGGSAGGHVLARASGRGFMKTPEFIAQAKSLRDQIPRSERDSILRMMASATVAAEVKDRVHMFSETLPEEFREAETNGLTPMQAALITYSVASDDLLMSSRENLQRQIEREGKDLRAEGKALGLKSDKAYGVNGARYSTPLNLVTDERTMRSLLNRLDDLTSVGSVESNGALTTGRRLQQ